MGAPSKGFTIAEVAALKMVQAEQLISKVPLWERLQRYLRNAEKRKPEAESWSIIPPCLPHPMCVELERQEQSEWFPTR
jgi:hypothetical protein